MVVAAELEGLNRGFYCGDFWCNPMESEPVAAERQPEKQAEEMLQNLKIDSTAKPPSVDASEAPAKEGSSSDATSSVTSSLGDATSTKESEVEQEDMVEQGAYYPANNYYGFYYPGYEAPVSEWDEHGCFIGMDGVEFQYPGIQAENGSLVYYMPSYGYQQPAYNPYNPYIPGALIGVDGQFLGHQPYYPGAIYQQPVSSPGYFQPPVQYGSEVMPAFAWESGLPVADRANGNGFSGSPTTGGPRQGYSVGTIPTHVPYLKSVPPAGKQSTAASDSKVSAQTSEGPQAPPVSVAQITTQGNMPSTGLRTQCLRPLSKIPQQVSTIQAAVLPKGYLPLGKVTACSNQGKGTVLYSNDTAEFKPNGRGWVGGDRLKMRGKVNGTGNLDALNEQNRGPRINRMRNPWLSPVDVSPGSQGVVGNTEGYSPAVNTDQYNLADFSTKFDNALFFVIKSYSEDDVHKSIKYNVWASTPNGNKRLDVAYQAAQDRSGGKPGSCPFFSEFSVPRTPATYDTFDFNKTMNFWQQDKWSGFFPVKWHIIKDIPNSQFRHIILENNENKPVTNSRDTQEFCSIAFGLDVGSVAKMSMLFFEIKFAQGIEMLNIFKNFSLKTSILDDFMFYESRQKAMQDKKTRQPTQQQQFQAAARVDVQQKVLDEQLCKLDEYKVSKPSDLSSPMSSGNGNQPSDSRKSVPSGSEDELAPCSFVDFKNESKVVDESPSVLESGHTAS
eukprot:Gb_40340 [translate_table: standard]